ncbi:MAG TPA: hypothetical protein VGD60_05350 [Candidatus Acidoferrales bacterium]
MKTIWKFPLVGVSAQIDMPEAAIVVNVDEQRGVPTLWALVDTERQRTARTFRIFGTGHPIDPHEANGLDYLGTLKLHAGELILHVFELLLKKEDDLPPLDNQILERGRSSGKK